MENNVRPAEMARITTPALAEAFIQEQIAAARVQQRPDLLKAYLIDKIL